MTSDEQSPQSVVTDPVGQQLRRARERLGLGLSDIADQQHLRSSIIQAIEDGDYQKIDTELFLKGYVRAYAKQVGLDADAVIRDLDAELEPVRQQRELELEANPLVDIERKKRRKRQVARVLAVLLLLGLVAAGLVYYVADTGGQRQPSESPAAASDVTATDNSTEVFEPTEGVEVGDSEQAQAVAPPETPAASEPMAAAPGDEASAGLPEDGTPTTDTAGPNTPLPDDTTTPETAISIDSVPVPEEAPALTVDEVPEVVETPDPALTQQALLDEDTMTPVELAIRFQGDCWVQITDAAGNRLASSLQRDGDELMVTGEAPLRVVIGAVSAVESIEFQGDALDMSDFRVVNNRAEFSLAP